MKRSSIHQLKLRTRCARCCKLGHWARECPEGSRRPHSYEKYDRRAVKPGENSRGFVTVAKPTERRPFFLGTSWTFVTLDPGEVLWDTNTQEGLVEKQHLDKWCEMLAEYGLQVEWSQKKPESASGIGGVTQPIGIVYVPVGLAECNGIIRFTVVEQDAPPLLPVGIMRTLRASLDLTEGGDKVIFRQFGRESSLRTLQSGHTAIRADQIDPDGWQIPETTGVQTTMKDSQQSTCQSSLTYTRKLLARTTIHQQETMTQHPHTVADHGRTQHRMSTDLYDLKQPTYPRRHLGSRAENQRMAFFRTMSGICGRALDATSPGETQRHGTLWAVKQWKRLAHDMLYVRCAAVFDTLSREFLMLISTGRSEDIRRALRRREQREMKNKKSNVSNFLEVQ